MGIFKRKRRDYLQSAYELYIGNARNQARNQFEYALWCARAIGAVSVFSGMETIKGCYKSPDNLNKAKLLLELGLQPMITIWFQNLESQESRSDEEKRQERVNAFALVQEFLGVGSLDLMKLYLGFDKEYICFLNRERRTDYYYVDMFYQRYRECISGEQVVDWKKLRFPLESQKELIDACYLGKYKLCGEPNESVFNMIALGGVIVDAGVVMFDEFRRMYNIEKK